MCDFPSLKSTLIWKEIQIDIYNIDEGKCTRISTTLDSSVVDIGGLVVRFSSPHFFLVQFSLGDTNCIANREYAMSTFIVAGS